MNPFPDRIRELKTWISEDTGPTASVEALMGTARHLGLTSTRAALVLGQVERAVSTWRDEAATLGLSDDEIESFADAFEHEERHAAQRYVS